MRFNIRVTIRVHLSITEFPIQDWSIVLEGQPQSVEVTTLVHSKLLTTPFATCLWRGSGLDTHPFSTEESGSKPINVGDVNKYL